MLGNGPHVWPVDIPNTHVVSETTIAGHATKFFKVFLSRQGQRDKVFGFLWHDDMQKKANIMASMLRRLCYSVYNIRETSKIVLANVVTFSWQLSQHTSAQPLKPHTDVVPQRCTKVQESHTEDLWIACLMHESFSLNFIIYLKEHF